MIIPFLPWMALFAASFAGAVALSMRRMNALSAVVIASSAVVLMFVLPPDISSGPNTEPVRDAFWQAFDALPQVSGMGPAAISVVVLIGIIVLLAIGMPLGFASAFLAVVVLYLRFGPDLLFRQFGTGPFNILPQSFYGLMTNYVLISVPLFIFMAALLERSGMARDMYSSLNVWLSRTRGGIALVTAIMAIIMAAMSGIIGGEVVLLGLIALPQMLRLGYDRNLAIGTICASGSLGTMIPPSIVLIIYGLITETSIKALFTAAFIPGFILATFYLIYIIVRTQLNPSLAPLPPEAEDDPMVGWAKPIRFAAFVLTLICFILVAAAGLESAQAYFGAREAAMITPLFGLFLAAAADGAMMSTLTPFEDALFALAFAGALFLSMLIAFGRQRIVEAWEMGRGLVAPLLVVFVVLGSIYGGVTGITEAAGMGVVAVLIFTLVRGELTPSLISEALMRTFKSTGTILMVTFGAASLAGAYSVAGGPAYVASLITGADFAPIVVILVMMLIFLFLGAIMDWVGIVLLVMPVFLPIVLNLDLGLTPSETKIWFGILFCVNMQVSFLSPPFGPAAFYLKSVAPPHITLPQIFQGFLPFICLQLLVLAIVLLVPGITLILV